MTIDLSAFTETKPAAKKAKTRPVIDDPKLRAIVDQVHEAKEKEKALKGAITSGTDAIREVAFPEWIDYNTRNAFETTVEVQGKESDGVLMVFSKGYRSGADKEKIEEAIGGDPKKAKETAEEFFRDKFALTIDGDSIPEEKQQDVVAGIAKVLMDAGINPAKVVKAKSQYIPKPDFNERRAHALTGRQNARLDMVLKTPTAIRNL